MVAVVVVAAVVAAVAEVAAVEWVRGPVVRAKTQRRLVTRVGGVARDASPE